MSVLWTAADAAAATGGRAAGDWQATGISIDSRSIKPGDLFVALTAARDGHDFVADALARGAAAALVSRQPEGVAEDAPLLVVPDVLAALTALGAAGRARARARVVAVTGSVGKTSTKEMLRCMLSGQGQVHAAQASYNNHWGVPITLAELPPEADFAIVEIGMNQTGEIAPLARLARPDVAMITTIAPAHLENLGSIEAIAREKATIFEGLAPDGHAVFPDDLESAPILARAAAEHAAHLWPFRAADGRIRLADGVLVLETDRAGVHLTLRLRDCGAHFATNALGCLAVAEALGCDMALAALDLGRWTPPAGRGRREKVVIDTVDGDSFELIDDAFNANPASMAAALDVLAAARPGSGFAGRPGRRIAILGDMLELGPEEDALHRAIAGHPALEGVALVHCVGPRMAALWQALPEPKRGQRCDTAEDLGSNAHKLVRPGDIVLVKGSKGSRVSRVVDALRNLGQSEPDQ